MTQESKEKQFRVHKSYKMRKSTLCALEILQKILICLAFI